MKQLLLFLCCVFCFNTILFSQVYQVEGIVTNEKDDTPLVGASVFINNGSQGATTDNEGRFILKGITYNTFELVVSFVSYETLVISISPGNIHKRFRIKLAQKQNELEEVIVGQVEKDGWKKWGKTFMENFLGKSVNARKCVLLNPETLLFRHNKKTGLLKVSAREQLKIRNNGLGYNVSYQLEQFEFDPAKGMAIYLGYVNFEDINSRRRRKNAAWIKERKIAYKGSMMHFMRTFYENKLTTEGFDIRQLTRLNKKDSLARPYYDRILKKNYSDIDTAKLSIQFVKQGFSDPVIYLLGKQLLSADSIRFFDTVYNQTLMLFNNSVQVIYNELESKEYLESNGRVGKPGPQTSIFYFTNRKPVVVQANGLYFEPLDILAEGYWAFEKLGELLPADYVIK